MELITIKTDITRGSNSRYFFLMKLQCGVNEPWKKSPGHVVPDSLQEQFSFGKPPDRKKEGVNTLRPRQNGLCRRHFKFTFFNENYGNLIQIALKCIPKGPINNNPSLVQIMACCWLGDEPLSEPMMAKFIDACMHHSVSVRSCIKCRKIPWFHWTLRV